MNRDEASRAVADLIRDHLTTPFASTVASTVVDALVAAGWGDLTAERAEVERVRADRDAWRDAVESYRASRDASDERAADAYAEIAQLRQRLWQVQADRG